jgi:hypothetical protein
MGPVKLARIAFVVFICAVSNNAQDTLQNANLVPEHLGPIESFMWERNGVMRKVFDFPLTQEGRTYEMQLRRNMLGLHQLGGLVTLAAMVSTVVLGQKVYNGNTDLSQIHKALAWTTIGTYSTTALLGIFTPPPLVRRKNWSSISTHKLLGTLHLTGMIMTPIIGTLVAGNHEELKMIHLASGYATTVIFGAAMLVVTF